MRSTGLLVLGILFSLHLSAQWDGVYRSGLTISLEVGLEQEPLVTYRPLVPVSNEVFLNSGSRPVAVLVTEVGDSLYYGLSNSINFRNRPEAYSQRSNLQLRLEKKMLSGLEFGGGLFLSKGSFSTRLSMPNTDLEDFAYGVSDIDYLKLGLTGSLKFHLFMIRRLQPYLGIQSLFLYERTLRSNQSILFPAYDREEILNVDDFIGPNSVFVLDLRLLIGVDYPLTERIHIGVNATMLGAATQRYAGVQVKYLTSKY